MAVSANPLDVLRNFVDQAMQVQEERPLEEDPSAKAFQRLMEELCPILEESGTPDRLEFVSLIKLIKAQEQIDETLSSCAQEINLLEGRVKQCRREGGTDDDTLLRLEQIPNILNPLRTLHEIHPRALCERQVKAISSLMARHYLIHYPNPFAD